MTLSAVQLCQVSILMFQHSPRTYILLHLSHLGTLHNNKEA